MSELKKLVDGCRAEVTAMRHDLHAHPELSNQELRTSGIIKQKLISLGLDSVETPYGTGVVGVLKGEAGEGRCIAVRADMDALPGTEDTGLEFSSENPGVMHACGHDMHVSMLLGLAKVLSEMKSELKGTVKFIFQPSEEVIPGGAKPMSEAGVMENPHVDAIVAMHVYPDRDKCGVFGLYKGGVCTGVDLFDFKITGQSGHGSMPHTAKDAILAASELVVALQQIVSRRVNPLDTAIFSIGVIKGGTLVNIIPGEAEIEGHSRMYDENTRRIIRDEVERISSAVALMSGCDIKVKLTEGYSPVVNDAGLVELAERSFKEALGEDACFYYDSPLSFSEDFSYYGKYAGVPSALFMLHAGFEGDELVSLHNPKCRMPDTAMTAGIEGMATLVRNYLND